MENARKAFDEHDKNNNGAIDVEEFQAMVDVSKSISEQLRKEAEALVEALKKKKDGEMSKKDFATTFGSIWTRLNGKDKEAAADKPAKTDKAAPPKAKKDGESKGAKETGKDSESKSTTKAPEFPKKAESAAKPAKKAAGATKKK